MATIALGTFTVTGPIQRTYIQLRGGDVVRVRATGEVNFGGGLLGILAPVLPPDGDNHPTPSHYPAPRLRKNSLILGVHLHGGGTVWHQGGRTASFTVGNVGPMHARFWFGANDATPDDNSGGWAVSIEIERPDSLSSSAIQLRVARIELVQSIQRIDNSVPLVAGKQTLVRVFVDSGRQAGSPRVGPLGGSLSVRWPDGRTDTASALNPPGGPTATVGHDRNALDDSVNFVLPINTTPGEASVRVRTWVTGRADLPGSSAVGELTARFVPGPSLAILPLLISVPSRSLPAPSEAQARRVLGAVEQRLPYAAGQFRVLPPVRVTGRSRPEGASTGRCCSTRSARRCRCRPRVTRCGSGSSPCRQETERRGSRCTDRSSCTDRRSPPSATGSTSTRRAVPTSWAMRSGSTTPSATTHRCRGARSCRRRSRSRPGTPWPIAGRR